MPNQPHFNIAHNPQKIGPEFYLLRKLENLLVHRNPIHVASLDRMQKVLLSLIKTYFVQDKKINPSIFLPLLSNKI